MKRAQDKITRRKPIARTCLTAVSEREEGDWRRDWLRKGTRRTKDNEIMVLRPAVILKVANGLLKRKESGRDSLATLELSSCCWVCSSSDSPPAVGGLDVSCTQRNRAVLFVVAL